MLVPLTVEPEELRVLGGEIDVAHTQIGTDATDQHVAGTDALVAGSLVASELQKIDASVLIALSVVVDQLATFGENLVRCATAYEQADAATALSIQAVVE